MTYSLPTGLSETEVEALLCPPSALSTILRSEHDWVEAHGDRDNPRVEIIHRGKFKSLTKPQRRWLKRRQQAVEPAIGHLKSNHRMDRCWLQGQQGDALHTVLCATGYNLRWLLRAMVRLGLKVAFLRPVLRVLMQLINGDHAQPDSRHQNFRLAGVLG